MRRSVFVILAAAAMAAAAATGEWTAKPGTDGVTVETIGTAQVGDVHTGAFLSVTCNRTRAPVAWLDYTIAEADKVSKVFDLSPFEGPDASAQARALVSVELVGDTAARPLIAHQSGWYSAEHEGGFGFGIGGGTKESKALAALIKRMAKSGTALRIHVASFDKPPRSIVSEFPLSGSRDALASLAKGCR